MAAVAIFLDIIFTDNKRLMIFKTLVLTLLTSALATNSYAEQSMPSFNATYKANVKGLSVDATRELTALNHGLYQLDFKATSWAANISESSAFKWQKGKIKPVRYDYEQKALGKNRTRQLTFDWNNQAIVSTEKGKSTVIPNKNLALDRLSYQLQLQYDLINNTQQLEYQIADRGKMKQYRFEVIGEEVIDTAVGQLNTVKIKVVRQNKGRITYLWFAKDWQYLLTRLEQYENNKKEFQLKLNSAQVGSKAVLGS